MTTNCNCANVNPHSTSSSHFTFHLVSWYASWTSASWWICSNIAYACFSPPLSLTAPTPVINLPIQVASPASMLAPMPGSTPPLPPGSREPPPLQPLSGGLSYALPVVLSSITVAWFKAVCTSIPHRLVESLKLIGAALTLLHQSS